MLPSTQTLSTSHASLGPQKTRSRGLRALLWLLASLVALAVLALVGYAVVFFKADVSAATMNERYGQPPSRFLTVQPAHGMRGRPVTVHLRDVGKPSSRVPVVLLSGTPSALFTWAPWMDRLGAERRVIAVDLPGFGLSDGFGKSEDGGPANFSSEHYGRFLLALLDQLGVQRALLVGQGFGGEVAWQTTYLDPERVTRLVLISSTGYPADPWHPALDDRLSRWRLTRVLERYTRAHFVVRRSLMDRYAHPERIGDEQVNLWFDLPLREGNRAAQAQRRRDDRNGGEAGRIAKLALPTLVIWGENDRQIPAQQAYWFQRDIAGAKVKLIPDTGNLPQEEAPDATLAAVLDFIGR